MINVNMAARCGLFIKDSNMTNGRPLDKGTMITVGSALLIIGALVTFAWRQSAWQAKVEINMENMANDLNDLKNRLVGESENEWQKSDMRLWVRELEISNPELIVPDVRNE